MLLIEIGLGLGLESDKRVRVSERAKSLYSRPSRFF